MPVVSNSSPLIALEQIGRLDLLQGLFAEIFLPNVTNGLPENWLSPRNLSAYDQTRFYGSGAGSFTLIR